MCIVPSLEGLAHESAASCGCGGDQRIPLLSLLQGTHRLLRRSLESRFFITRQLIMYPPGTAAPPRALITKSLPLGRILL